jgi:hypothetical protein
MIDFTEEILQLLKKINVQITITNCTIMKLNRLINKFGRKVLKSCSFDLKNAIPKENSYYMCFFIAGDIAFEIQKIKISKRKIRNLVENGHEIEEKYIYQLGGMIEMLCNVILKGLVNISELHDSMIIKSTYLIEVFKNNKDLNEARKEIVY